MRLAKTALNFIWSNLKAGIFVKMSPLNNKSEIITYTMVAPFLLAILCVAWAINFNPLRSAPIATSLGIEKRVAMIVEKADYVPYDRWRSWRQGFRCAHARLELTYNDHKYSERACYSWIGDPKLGDMLEVAMAPYGGDVYFPGSGAHKEFDDRVVYIVGIIAPYVGLYGAYRLAKIGRTKYWHKL